MSTVHLIEGPVGAGKSTYSLALARQVNGVHIPLDDWFVNLFSPDRPDNNFISWYVERKERLLDLIWSHSLRILSSSTDVILELGLIQREARLHFCNRVQNEGLGLVVHVLDAPNEVRRQRVQRRNVERGSTFFMVVPDHVFDIASKMWEPPDDAECAEYQVKFIPLMPESSLDD